MGVGSELSAPLPNQVDLQLESGEYFLAQQERAKRSRAAQQTQQAERTADRKRQRQQAFMAPQVRQEPSMHLVTVYRLLVVSRPLPGCMRGDLGRVGVQDKPAEAAAQPAAQAAKESLAELTQSLKKKAKRKAPVDEGPGSLTQYLAGSSKAGVEEQPAAKPAKEPAKGSKRKKVKVAA